MVEEEDLTLTPGCTAVYGIIISLAGLGVFLWAAAGTILGQGPDSLAAALGLAQTGPVIVAGVILGLLMMLIGGAMAAGKVWAWWLVLLFHLGACLLSLAGILLPLFVSERSFRMLRPLPALMGLMVNLVLLAYFWQARDEMQKE